MINLVGWNYSDERSSHARVRAANQALSGADAALPNTYSKGAKELARLMENLRKELGGAGT
jgi:hypothetical protein